MKETIEYDKEGKYTNKQITKDIEETKVEQKEHTLRGFTGWISIVLIIAMITILIYRINCGC